RQGRRRRAVRGGRRHDPRGRRRVEFKAPPELFGETPTGVVVPPEIVDKLGAGRRPAGRVAIKRHTHPTPVAGMSGKYMIGVAREHREAAGVAAGDVLTLDVVLDDEPRTVTVPKDLAAALKKDPAAKQAFDKLSYTHRKEHVRALEDAKKPGTRQRR